MTTYTADRKGHVTENDSFQDRFLEKMYGSAIGRALLKPLVNPVLSEIGGRILDSRVSALAVPAFIRHAGIDMRDYEPKKYWSYNDFFTRQIRESGSGETIRRRTSLGVPFMCGRLSQIYLYR